MADAAREARAVLDPDSPMDAEVERIITRVMG